MSSRFAPPDPEFLPGIRVDTTYAGSGSAPIVTLFHPHAHSRNLVAGTAMLAIAAGLGLRYGRSFPPTGRYVYDIHNTWSLDYGHPRDVLSFVPRDLIWPHVVRGCGGALVVVSLEHEPRPADDRMLTGRLALRLHAPREWMRAQ
ncbi:hypothetical protein [Streptomyces sp. 3211]|uniref:hypothetical protein n=1 Tax=Streptomyces sp. 3211 TaxID=1964449 RepID=UPI0009A4A78D|nr:hypothetical protein [Streptomyces sp. 3211]